MVYITWNITLKIELNVIYDFFLQTAVFETQCNGSGCTFNGCESSGSDTCDGQMFLKLKEILSSINNIWKTKPTVIGKNTIFREKWCANVSASWLIVQIVQPITCNMDDLWKRRKTIYCQWLVKYYLYGVVSCQFFIIKET